MLGLDAWVWLVVLIIAIIFEVITAELVSVWFAVGSIFAIILACFTDSWIAEACVFVIVSILLLVFTRKFFMKLLNKSNLKTNVQAFVGMKIKLDKIESGGYAYFKVNGIDWKVVGQNELVLSTEKNYEVVEVQGNKFIVKEL